MSASVLPEGWILQYDASSGRERYLDTTTGEAHWTLPGETPANGSRPSTAEYRQPAFQSENVGAEERGVEDDGPRDRGFASDMAMKIVKNQLNGGKQNQGNSQGGSNQNKPNDLVDTITGVISNALSGKNSNQQGGGNQGYGNQSGNQGGNSGKSSDVVGMVTGAISNALSGKNKPQNQGNQGSQGNQGNQGTQGQGFGIPAYHQGQEYNSNGQAPLNLPSTGDLFNNLVGGGQQSTTGAGNVQHSNANQTNANKPNDLFGSITGAISGALGGSSTQQGQGGQGGQGYGNQGQGNQGYGNQGGGNQGGKPGKSDGVVGLVTGLLSGKASKQKPQGQGNQGNQGYGKQQNNQGYGNQSGGNYGGASDHSGNQSGGWHPGKIGNSPEYIPPPGSQPPLPGAFPGSQNPSNQVAQVGHGTQGGYGGQTQPYAQQSYQNAGQQQYGGYNQTSPAPPVAHQSAPFGTAAPQGNPYGQGYGQGQYGQGQYNQGPQQPSYQASPPPQAPYGQGSYGGAGAAPYQAPYQQNSGPSQAYGQPQGGNTAYGQGSPSASYGQGPPNTNNYPYSNPQGPGRREVEDDFDE